MPLLLRTYWIYRIGVGVPLAARRPGLRSGSLGFGSRHPPCFSCASFGWLPMNPRGTPLPRRQDGSTALRSPDGGNPLRHLPLPRGAALAVDVSGSERSFGCTEPENRCGDVLLEEPIEALALGDGDRCLDLHAVRAAAIYGGTPSAPSRHRRGPARVCRCRRSRADSL